MKQTVNLIFLILLSFYSCTNDKYPMPVKTKINKELCDSLSISFKSDVQPILQNNGCVGCHSSSFASGGISLENYSDFDSDVLDKLTGSINHDDGYSAMPQGNDKLADSLIVKIECWINNGAQNN